MNRDLQRAGTVRQAHRIKRCPRGGEGDFEPHLLPGCGVPLEVARHESDSMLPGGEVGRERSLHDPRRGVKSDKQRFPVQSRSHGGRIDPPITLFIPYRSVEEELAALRNPLRGRFDETARNAATEIGDNAEEIRFRFQPPFLTQGELLFHGRMREVGRFPENSRSAILSKHIKIARKDLAPLYAEISHEVPVDRPGRIDGSARVAHRIVHLDLIDRSIGIGPCIVVYGEEKVGVQGVGQGYARGEVVSKLPLIRCEQIPVDRSGEPRVRAGVAQQSPQVERDSQVDILLPQPPFAGGPAETSAVSRINDDYLPANGVHGEFLPPLAQLPIELVNRLLRWGWAAAGEQHRSEHQQQSVPHLELPLSRGGV